MLNIKSALTASAKRIAVREPPDSVGGGGISTGGGGTSRARGGIRW